MKKILFVCMLLLPFTLSARWALPSDASIEVLSYQQEITVHADGQVTERIISHDKILKEPGIQYFANLNISYNSDAEEVKILAAKTVVHGVEYPVDLKMLEDKPLASSPQGFDQLNQILVALPKLEIGAEVHLTLEKRTKIPRLENYFSRVISYGGPHLWKKSKIIINSEIPLYFKVHDPKSYLNVSATAPVATKQLTLEQQRPFIEHTIDDLNNVNSTHTTWVAISSLKNWSDYVMKFAPRYRSIINEELPTLFADIVEQARQETDPHMIINTVTSQLATKVQYMGDWRTVAGRYFPHKLAHIAKAGLGDCKDYSIATAAMLKKLGFKVSPTFVNRGEGRLDLACELPMLDYFNHAILTATKHGKTYWLDPTNFVSMAQGIFPDIAGKRAIIIDPQLKVPYQHIPLVNPKHNQTLIQEDCILDTHQRQQTLTGHLKLYGEMALSLTGSQLQVSDETIQEYIFNLIGDASLDASKKIILPPLSSRIVKNLDFQFEIKQPVVLLNTNIGPGLPLPVSPSVQDFINLKTDIVSDIYLGPPRTITYIKKLKNYSTPQIDLLSTTISSKWLDFSRTLQKEQDDLVIIDKTIIKKSFITNDDFNSTTYKQLQEQINTSVRHAALIGTH